MRQVQWQGGVILQSHHLKIFIRPTTTSIQQLYLNLAQFFNKIQEIYIDVVSVCSLRGSAIDKIITSQRNHREYHKQWCTGCNHCIEMYWFSPANLQRKLHSTRHSGKSWHTSAQPRLQELLRRWVVCAPDLVRMVFQNQFVIRRLDGVHWVVFIHTQHLVGLHSSKGAQHTCRDECTRSITCEAEKEKEMCQTREGERERERWTNNSHQK